jgi:cytochrome b6-f complex iron-sulfur subunit
MLVAHLQQLLAIVDNIDIVGITTGRGGSMVDNNSRRTFLALCLGGLAAIAAAAVSWPLFRYLSPRSGGETAGKIVIPDTDVREGEAKFFEFAGSAAVLVRKRGGDLVAFSAVCTHLGCIVQWEKDKQDFLCPCHAGHYSADGEVTAGPPPNPLKKLPFSVAGGNIIVG